MRRLESVSWQFSARDKSKFWGGYNTRNHQQKRVSMILPSAGVNYAMTD
jgi:hypothetical protein